MRTNSAGATLVGLTLALTLGACSGDSEDPSASPSGAASSPGEPLTEATIACPEFEDAAARIAEAQTELYSGTADREVVDELVAELDALKPGAPPEVQDALDDIGEGFRDAAELLEKPDAEAQAELARIAPDLAADGETVTEYITSQCG